jgi:hypothetical protein
MGDWFVSPEMGGANRGERMMSAETLQALALLVAWLTVAWLIRRLLGEEETSKQSRRVKKRR